MEGGNKALSKKIDERVVEMRFDNKQFESATATTMSTLDKLKQKLNFSGATKGLNDVGTAAKTTEKNMTPLAGAVQSVEARFSALQVMGVTALANITNSAVNAGKRIVSALTIDPVKTGLEEYETQMNAVQTILANTQSKGSTLDDVNRALAELNTYADQTIYNFTEMTRNIGTFTAAGVDLDKSVTSIKGIANLAAVSGSNAQQASTAMYQLSQALAAGRVSLMDWNSVVNAGMGGEVFQTALKRTAKQMGHDVDALIEKYGSFRESLTKGQWLTAEVLTETLTQLSGAYTEADLIAQGYSEKQAKEIVELANTAVSAATDVKTFTGMMDTLKESLQSGWAQSWQTIIGDFEQAKELWSSISELFGGAIQSMSDARNALLGGALDSNWEKLTDKVVEAGISVEDFNSELEKTARAKVPNFDEIVKKSGSLAKAFQDGSLSSNLIIETLQRMGGVSTKASGETEDLTKKLEKFQKVVDEVWKGNYKNVDTGRIEALKKAGYDYAEVQALVNKTVDGHRLTLEDLNETQLKSIGYTDEEVSALKSLAEQAAKTGTPINELITNITKPSGRDLLWGGIINIFQSLLDIAGAVRDAWNDAFSIDSGGLYSLIEAFNSLTEALKPSDETLKGLTSTLKGLFAILDIIVSVVEGVIKTVFSALGSVLGTVDFNILSVTGSIGESIAAFRDWLLEGGTLTNVLSKLGDILVTVGTAVKDFISSLGQLPLIKNAVAALRNGLSDLPKVGQWIVDGLQNGLVDGITSIPKTIVSIATSILDTFKKILGINSPSRETYEIGKFTIEGFLNGFVETAGKVFTAIGEFGSQLVSTIGGIISKIDWGAVFAVAFSGGLLYAGIKVAKAIEQFSAPFEGIGDVLSGVGNVLDEFADNIGRFSKSITKYINAKAFAVRADAVQTLAISLAIMSASLLVLSQIPWQKLLVGLGGLLGVAVIVGALSVAIGKFGPQSSVKFIGFGAAIMGIATSLTVVSAAIKILDSLDPEKADQTLNAFIIMLTTMSAFLAVCGVVAKVADGKALTKLGSLMMKLSVSLALMVGVIKLIGTLDNNELVRGGVAITTFLGVVSMLSLLTTFTSKNVSKLGTMMLKLSVSLYLLVGVIKLIGGLSLNEITKGGIALTAFIGVITTMAIISSLAPQTAKVGSTLLAMSAAMLVLVAVVKLLGTLSVEEIVKGGLGIAAFTVVMKTLITSLKGFEKDAPKIAGTLLAMSLSVGILAAVAVTLSLISIPGLIKGVTAVTILGTIMSLMAASTRYASDVKGTMIAMSVAIGIMAAAVAGLSFIDPVKLASATAAIGVLMGMFAVILAASGNVNASIGTLTVMSTAIALLGGIVYLLAGLPVESVLGSAAAMSALLLSLSASLKILDGVKKISGSAMAAILVLTGAVAGIAAILGVLDMMNVEPSIETATALSILLATMSGVCLALTVVGKTGPAAIQGAAIFDGVIVVLGGLMAGLGALVTYFPQLEQFVDKGIDLLEAVGQGIGGFLGGIVGGVLSGITSGLPDVATDLSQFMTNLTPFINGVKTVDAETVTAVESIAKMILALSAANFIKGITDLFGFITGGGSFASLGEDLVPFGESMALFGEKVANINPEAVNAAANAGMMIAELVKSLPRDGGLLQKFFGSQDLGAFSDDMAAFGDAIVAFSNVIAPNGKSLVNASAVEAAANAGKLIADLNSSIPSSGGALQSFLGEKDLGKFATDMGLFGEAIIAFSNKVAPNGNSIVSAEAVEAAANAGKVIADLNSELPASGGFLQRILGEKSMADFGDDLLVFGESLAAYSESIKDIKPETVTASANAASTLVELANALPNSGGLISLFSGDNDFATFGSQLSDFGGSLSDYYEQIKGISPSKLTGIVGEIKRIVDMAKGMDGVDFSALGSFGKNLKKLGNSGIDEFIKAFNDASSRVQTAANSMIDVFIKAVSARNADFNRAFTDPVADVVDNLHKKADDFKMVANQFATKLSDGFKEKEATINATLSAISKNMISNLRANYSSFKESGGYLMSGFVAGMKSYGSTANAAARTLAQNVLNSMKRQLDIHSPSRVVRDEVGHYVVEGLAEGITEDMTAEEAAAKKAQNIVDAFQTEFEKLDLADQTAELKEQLEGISDIDGEIVRQTERRNLALAKYNEMVKVYGEQAIETQKVYNEYLQEEIDLRDKAAEKAQDAYENSVEWIENHKSAGELSLVAELAAWKRIQAQYEEGTEARIKADEEILRIQEEIQQATDDYYNNLNDIQEEADQKRLELDQQYADDRVAIQEETTQKLADLDQEYADKTKEINDQLKADIESLEQTYEDAVSSRSETLYGAYGLFDAVEEPEEVTGETLTNNLQGQLDAFEQWTEDINALAEKGLDEGLMEELRQLGPSSAAQIAALNAMTSEELDKYVSLWRQKHELATQQAKYELESLRVDTQMQIAQLREDARVELEEYRATWQQQVQAVNDDCNQKLIELRENYNAQIDQLNADTQAKLEEVKTTWLESIRGMEEETTTEFSTLTKKIIDIVGEKTQWSDTGAGIIDGILEGIANNTSKLTEGVKSAMQKAITAAQKVYTSGSTVKTTSGGLQKVWTSSSSNSASLDRNSVDYTNKLANSVSNTIVKDNGKVESSGDNDSRGPTYQFTQNNYSPKALSRVEIYRQTNNQLSRLGTVVSI